MLGHASFSGMRPVGPGCDSGQDTLLQVAQYQIAPTTWSLSKCPALRHIGTNITNVGVYLVTGNLYNNKYVGTIKPMFGYTSCC